MSRRFRRIAIICLLLLLPLAAYNLWDYIELRRLIAEIEAIQAKGEPVSDPRVTRSYDLLPADQQRAGDYYAAAAALALHTKPHTVAGPIRLWLATASATQGATRELPAGVPAPTPASGATPVRAGAAQRAATPEAAAVRDGTSARAEAREAAAVGGGTTGRAPARGAAVARDGAAGRVAVPVELIEHLRAVVDASPEALALVDKAAALPFGGLPPAGEYGFRISGLMTLSRLVGARTLLLSVEGRGDEAIDSAVAALAIRRPLWDLRWMIAPYDYEIAAILSLSTPSAAALQRLDAALATTMPAVGPVDHVLATRAEYLGQMWRRYYGTDPAMPTFYTLPMRSVGETLLRPFITQGIVRSLQSWAAMIPASRLPAQRRLEAMRTIAEARAWMAPELANAFARTRVQMDALTMDGCVRIAIAVERFRRDHAGTVPASLAQLVPQYLPAIPVDPAIDAPLRYRAQADANAHADAYIVYGVGRDQKDDGGDLTSVLRPGDRPDSAAVRVASGRDLGVRVLVR